METISVGHYGGIFKFVWTEKARTSFLKGRTLISENNFPDAIGEFQKSRQLCENEEDVKIVDLVLEEIQRHLDCSIVPSREIMSEIDWEAVTSRNQERIDEDLDRLPQGVFLLKTKIRGIPLEILGRKTLSQLWLKNLIPELFCSQIRPTMLLGVLADWRVTDSKLITFYHAMNDSEKLSVFNKVASSTCDEYELVFPFPLVKTYSREEFTSPLEGWDVDTSFDHTLSSGEEHIRQVTVDILLEFGFTSHRLYDPACSTGVFLNSLKQAFPACTTIGQDLSRKMCDVAKERVDEVHCGSAIKPMVSAGSAHCVFIRFLNSEVVTTAEAEALFLALLPSVAVGGIVIVFGHTPVLLSSALFKSVKGFKLLRCVSGSKDRSSIIQYYVIKRLI